MKKTILAIAVATSALTGCSKDSTTLTFQKELTFEYGEQIDVKALVKESNAEKINYPKIDLHKIGKQTLTFDADGEEFTCTITIKDSKKPIIKLLENPIKIKKGNDFDILDYIDNVYDEVDGELTFSKQKTKNHYCVEGSVDSTKVGTYKLNVIAVDKNNNESQTAVEVIVENQQATPHQEVDYPMDEKAIQDREQIFARLNEERGKKGLRPFQLDTSFLQKAAMIRAKEVSKQHSSTRPDGRDCFSVVTDLDIPFIAVAENFAYNCSSQEAAVSSWLNDIDRYRNITAPDFDTVAIGVYDDSYVVIFIGSGQ